MYRLWFESASSGVPAVENGRASRRRPSRYTVARLPGPSTATATLYQRLVSHLKGTVALSSQAAPFPTSMRMPSPPKQADVQSRASKPKSDEPREPRNACLSSEFEV